MNKLRGKRYLALLRKYINRFKCDPGDEAIKMKQAI